MTMTIGEYRVGISFNPSSNPQVDAIKRAAADFIDFLFDPAAAADESAVAAKDEAFRKCVDAIDISGIPERGRLCDIALVCMDEVDEANAEAAQVWIESAAMWAVKAATKGPHE